MSYGGGDAEKNRPPSFKVLDYGLNDPDIIGTDLVRFAHVRLLGVLRKE